MCGGTVRAMELRALAAALVDHPAATGIDLLVLHGSRARGDAGAGSDWDLGLLASPGADVDPAALLDAVASLVATDAVDVVDLARAGALLRFRAARDGVALVERRAEAFLDFRLEAIRFWCDAGLVIRAAQAEVLAALP